MQMQPADRFYIEEFDIGDKVQATKPIIKQILSIAKDPYSPLELMLANTTANIIFDFRSKALRSYDKDEFRDVPKQFKPFLERDYAMAKGRETEYHSNRCSYIQGLLQAIEKEPAKLLDIETSLLRFFHTTVMMVEMPEKSRNNAWLQFRQLEANVADLYTLFSVKKGGFKNYVTGIEENGRLHFKRAKQVPMTQFVGYYSNIHAHALTFLTLEARIVQELIPDDTVWAHQLGRLAAYDNVQNGSIGFEMLQAGQDHKHFHSSLPHEIIIRDCHLKSISVRDDPPKSIYFLVKYFDDSVSLGAMSTPYPDGQTVALLSDMPAEAIMNNVTKTTEQYILYDLAGSIARDMFVCDEKDKYFSISEIKAKSKKAKGKIRERIIWLPRFKLHLQGKRPDYHGDQILSLSPSHVTGYQRPCENPSKKQLKLAESLGVVMKPGHNRIREHDRPGSREFTRHYKSRSAIQTLYGSSQCR